LDQEQLKATKEFKVFGDSARLIKFEDSQAFKVFNHPILDFRE
jgi:hypothetical protein